MNLVWHRCRPGRGERSADRFPAGPTTALRPCREGTDRSVALICCGRRCTLPKKISTDSDRCQNACASVFMRATCCSGVGRRLNVLKFDWLSGDSFLACSAPFRLSMPDVWRQYVLASDWLARSPRLAVGRNNDYVAAVGQFKFRFSRPNFPYKYSRGPSAMDSCDFSISPGCSEAILRRFSSQVSVRCF